MATYKKYSLPEKHGQYYYFFHDNNLFKMNEPDYYKMDEEDPLKDARMFIDVKKAFPKNYDKLDWTTSVWSPNNKYLAYVTKSSGSDWKSV
jgi:hypothetical protein